MRRRPLWTKSARSKLAGFLAGSAKHVSADHYHRTLAKIKEEVQY
jgi:hypothetical protein